MEKKVFSSVDTVVTVQELKDVIVNSRINKIYQYDKNIILLKIHKKDSPQIRLVMEAGKRFHLTSYVIPPPKNPPGFCMALRKHLSGAWIDKVEQFEFERIILLHLRKKIGNWKLILELFGEGNIILTDGKDKILQAMIFKKMRDRNILRNETYRLPPSISKNPFKIKKEELTCSLKEQGKLEVVRAIARLLGVGGVYSEEILSRANVEKTKLCGNLTDSDFQAIFDSLQDVLSSLKNFKINPRLIIDENNEILDVIPISLKRYEKYKFKTLKTFNEAVDKFFLSNIAEKKAIFGGKTDKLSKKLQQIERIIDEQKQVLEKQKKNITQNKNFGDTIYAHSNELQILLNIFSINNRADKNWTTLFKEVMNAKKERKTPANLVESFDSKNLTANMNIENIRFILQLRRNIFENAARYYDLSKKAKQKFKGATAALKLSLKKHKDLTEKLKLIVDFDKEKPKQILIELEKTKIKSKKWYEKFRWFRTSDDFLVVAGKDSVSNEVLIKKYTNPQDPVFHADIMGAPFVVIKVNKNMATKKSLSEASEFAAALSRAWREGAGTADVYWVRPDQLSKSGPSGEYVPRGGFVVHGKRNWIRNVPLKLAIGLINSDSDLNFIGGPVSSVKALTNCYVILIPGDLKGKEMLKITMKSLIVKAPKTIKDKVSKVSFEQIRDFIPYTKGRIINE